MYYGQAVQMRQLGTESHNGIADQTGRREWASGTASKLKTSLISNTAADNAEVKFRFCKCIEQNR